MSLEVKSNQFLYNITELLHRKKYNRVIRICEFLESQGISSHEFIVAKSYALAHSRGYQEALNYLQPFQGLLVNAAKAQYQQTLNLYSDSTALFHTLTTPDGNAVLEYLRDNNQILAGSSRQNILESIEEKGGCRFIINKKQEEIINKINNISNDYQQQKKLFQEGAISKENIIQKCETLIAAYQAVAATHRLKGKLKELIDNYILYLSRFIQASQ